VSIALVITGGFGNGTLTGDVSNVVTRGYSISEAVAVSGPRLGVTSAVALSVGVNSELALTAGKESNVSIEVGKG
jgi:hypothetical protein